MFKISFLISAITNFIIVISPGFQRTIPSILAPSSELGTTTVTQYILGLTIASLIVTTTATSMANVLFSREKSIRQGTFSFICADYLIISLLISTASETLKTILKLENTYPIELWAITWGFYQLSRTYLISNQEKKLLVTLEIFAILIFTILSITTHTYSIKKDYILLIPAISLTPFIYITFMKYSTRSKVNRLEYVQYSLSNICSLGPLMLSPTLISIYGAQSSIIIFSGQLVMVISVASLSGRLLSNIYLPQMANCSGSKKTKIFNEFRNKNLKCTALIIPFSYTLISIFFHYQKGNFPENGYIYISLCLSWFFFSQLQLPYANYLVSAGNSKLILKSNALSSILFFSLIGGTYFYSPTPTMIFFSLLLSAAFRFAYSSWHIKNIYSL